MVYACKKKWCMPASKRLHDSSAQCNLSVRYGFFSTELALLLYLWSKTHDTSSPVLTLNDTGLDSRPIWYRNEVYCGTDRAGILYDTCYLWSGADLGLLVLWARYLGCAPSSVAVWVIFYVIILVPLILGALGSAPCTRPLLDPPLSAVYRRPSTYPNRQHYSRIAISIMHRYQYPATNTKLCYKYERLKSVLYICFPVNIGWSDYFSHLRCAITLTCLQPNVHAFVPRYKFTLQQGRPSPQRQWSN